MPDLETMKQLAEEHKNTFIKINRVPYHIKELFKQIAKEEFCEDYGLFLRELLMQYLEYQKLKECLLDKEYLSYILESKSQIEKKENPEGKKMFSGRIVKGGERK